MKCLCAKTRRTARMMSKFYEDRLRPAGLTVAQFELLSELAGRPDRPQTGLAADLGLDQTTLSRNLKAMIGYGWLAAETSAKDKRQARYSLTPAGRETLQQALPRWQQAHNHVQEHLGKDWDEAWVLLDRLAVAVSA